MTSKAIDRGNLILTRTPGSSVFIGENITVTYLERDGTNAIKLKISAPKELNISRVKSNKQQLIKQ